MEKQETKSGEKREAFAGFSRTAKTHPTSMLDLLKMYFYRLLHSKMVYVIYGIVVLVAIIAVIVLFENNAQQAKLATENGTTYTPVASLSQIALWCFSVPLLSATASNIILEAKLTSVFSMAVTAYFPIGFLALFVIAFFVGKDWRNRTFRNQILAGHSRLEIYLCAQIVSLVIALGLVAVWELTLWAFGSAMRVPAFLEGQFNYTLSDGTKVVSNTTGVFVLSFFMCLILYIVTSVLACSWCFIIPNSWGAIGLLYATFQLFNLVSVIVYAAASINYNTYYLFQEWLMPYQMGLYSNYFSDLYGQYRYVNSSGSSYSSSGWRLEIYNGRAGLLALKTVVSSLVLMGGMGYLGGLAFMKRDLK